MKPNTKVFNSATLLLIYFICTLMFIVRYLLIKINLFNEIYIFNVSLQCIVPGD